MDVRSLRAGEEQAAAYVLRDAFMRGTFAKWISPVEEDRMAGLEAMFTEVLAQLPPGAEVDVTDALDAVAIWLPPGSEVHSPPPPHARPAVEDMFRRINAAAPSQPFWYLDFLGARTAGTGSGTALMQHRAGLRPAALWTNSEDNVAFYAGHGFRVLSREDGDDVSTWWLWRD